MRELRYNLARDLMDAGRPADAIPVLTELWEDEPDEGRFGAKRFECHLALGDTAAARETLNLLLARKTTAAAAAREALEADRASWPDNKPPADLGEDERRRLVKLRKRAGVNRATFAYFRGRLLRAEGRPADALLALEQAAGAEMHHQPSLLQAKAEVLLDLHRPGEAERC